jgi:hypothetical protein
MQTKCNNPEVWYDPNTITNIFILLEMEKKYYGNMLPKAYKLTKTKQKNGSPQ